ncbi:MAG: hypothetical protein LWX83_18955 [Anaerolineae bacterium]|nr:hypothetical protein [Anaerolineae bacterium]
MIQVINDGHIVIVLTALYKPLSAHYRLLTAIDSDFIEFIDPAYNQKSLSHESTERFIKTWKNAANIFIEVFPTDY